MKILISISDNKYMLWQLLVQQCNFDRFGFSEKTLYVVTTNGDISDELNRIINSNELKCSFELIEDTREKASYKPSVRHHTFAKLFRSNPSLSNETFFYIDVDVLFTNRLDLEAIYKPNVWMCSDTTNYTGIDYILKNGGRFLFAQMCDIVGMNSDYIMSIPSGGAHYIMDGLTADYWEKGESQSEMMFNLLSNCKITEGRPNLINAWCAEMWVTVWNSVHLKKTVEISNELDFAWATDTVDKWDIKNLFHLAGHVAGKQGFFNKHEYMNTTPFNKDLSVSAHNCTYNYVQWIKETEIVYKNLIF